MAWIVEHYDDYVEILPDNDEREHVTGQDCWCEPYEELDEFGNAKPIVTHNHSFDLRLTKLGL